MSRPICAGLYPAPGYSTQLSGPHPRDMNGIHVGEWRHGRRAPTWTVNPLTPQRLAVNARHRITVCNCALCEYENLVFWESNAPLRPREDSGSTPLEFWARFHNRNPLPPFNYLGTPPMQFSPRYPNQVWHATNPTDFGVWIWSREKYPDYPPLPEFEGVAVCNCRTCNVLNMRAYRAAGATHVNTESGINSLRDWILHHRLPMPASMPQVEMCVSCGTRPAHREQVVAAFVPNSSPPRRARLCQQCAQPSRGWQWTAMNEHGAPCYVRAAEATIVYNRDEYATLTWLAAHGYYHTETDRWFSSAEEYREWQSREARRATELQARADGGHVWGYHEVNNIQLFGWPKETPRAALCFGVELEMEHKRDNTPSGQVALSQALQGRIGGPKRRYVLARDGSLNASGVELITNPYTLAFHQNEFDWPTVLSGVAKIGRSGKNTSACGMHVHCNRKAISALQLGKALVLVNSPKNKALVTRIAQRESNNYTNLIQKKLADGRVANSSKYEAMHLSAETVEFRIFKGNLRYDRVLKNIEFCHSVLMFAKAASNKECEDFNAYLAYIVGAAKMYPHLISFLREKDTVAIRKGAPQIQITEEV